MIYFAQDTVTHASGGLMLHSAGQLVIQEQARATACAVKGSAAWPGPRRSF
jgi:hypothetical protein